MLEFLALVEDMVKTRNAQIVTILGSIGLMFGVSAMCGVSASEENPSRPFHLAQYMAPPQPMGQSLGTVRQGDINNQQQNPTPYANPSMPPISSMSATPLFDSATVLQPVQIGDVSYLTGGIGDEER
jgi:hypothetical protein